MGNYKKCREKFFKKPMPNDITFNEVECVFEHLGCNILGGGNHMKVVYAKLGIVIPVPRHRKCVGEAYIKQLKNLISMIEGE